MKNSMFLLSLLFVILFSCAKDKSSITNFNEESNNLYTDLSGIISKNDSPFYIEGPTRVPKGKTLIIKPGVTILFKAADIDSGDFWWHDSTIDVGFLRVDGKLIAEGTQTDSIIFTKNSSKPNDYWGIIYFSETADPNSIISFSRIEYASSILDIESRVIGRCITCWFSNVTIKNNLIQNNIDFGVYLSNSETIVENNIIKNCHFGINTWAFDQYAYLQPVIRNNIVIRNRWMGISIFKPNPLLENNTICFNENHGLHIEIIQNQKSINNIIWGNGNAQVFLDLHATIDLSYSDIEGGWPGAGNIDSDPLFINPQNNDYHLSDESPCKNAGSPLTEYNDHDGSRNDMGAYGGPHGNW
jgi:parallel beta-helix repeat protein